MVLFGVKVSNHASVPLFVKKMQKKLQSPDMFENPFKGNMAYIKGKQPYIITYMDLVWFNPIYPTLFLSIGLLVANWFRWHWSYFILLPLWLGCFMFTSIFIKLAFRYSLRRFGYPGPIKFMSSTELLMRSLEWGKEK